MGKINNYRKRLSFINDIHATLDSLERRDAIFDLFASQSQLLANRNRRKRIVNVKFSRDSASYVVFFTMIINSVGTLVWRKLYARSTNITSLQTVTNGTLHHRHRHPL